MTLDYTQTRYARLNFLITPILSIQKFHVSANPKHLIKTNCAIISNWINKYLTWLQCSLAYHLHTHLNNVLQCWQLPLHQVQLWRQEAGCWQVWYWWRTSAWAVCCLLHQWRWSRPPQRQHATQSPSGTCTYSHGKSPTVIPTHLQSQQLTVTATHQ